MICKECGTQNNATAKFCRACGSKLEEITVQEQKKNFCPACGSENSENAAFCRNCGMQLVAAQSTVASATENVKQVTQNENIQKMTAASKSAFSKAFSMIKMAFADPISAIKSAREDEEYWMSTLIVCLIKDFLIALLPILRLSSYINSQLGAYAELASEYMKENLGIGLPGLFFALFFMLVACDAAIIFVTFGIGKAFGGQVALKNYIGALSPSMIFNAAGSLLVILLLMMSPEGLAVPAAVVLSIVMILQMILIWKAFEVSMEMNEQKAFYAFALAIAAAIIADLIIFKIIQSVALEQLSQVLESEFRL